LPIGITIDNYFDIDIYFETIFMKQFILSVLFLSCFSCIPLRIAPNIKTDKVMLAKKFKRKLPRQHAFIFEDPKDANEFYNYVNIKYELNHQDVEWNVPFEIDDKIYYFSFYEVEIPNKTINFLPLFVDTALDNKGWDPMFEDVYLTRKGNWYIALMVSDYNNNDCLKSDYIHRDRIIKELKALRVEYLNTHNYLEALLKK